MNSICPSAVTVSNSSRANSPFSPTSMYTPSRGRPSSRHGRAPGWNASLTRTGCSQSTSGIGFPLRRTGPYLTSRQAIEAVGLISIVTAASGVRPSRNSSIECAPAMADFASNVALGFSSECVYGMLNPIPRDPLGFDTREEPDQAIPLEHRFGEIAEQLAQHQRTVLGTPHDDGQIESGDRGGRKDVAPFDVDRDAAAIRFERAGRGSHFILEE